MSGLDLSTHAGLLQGGSRGPATDPLDHLKLSYLYQGRDQRLTDVHGDREFSKFLLRA